MVFSKKKLRMHENILANIIFSENPGNWKETHQYIY